MFGKIASGIAGAASKAGALGDQFKGATDKAGAMGKNIQGVVGQADAMGKNIQGVVGQNPANSNSLFSSLSKSAGNFTQTAKSVGELSQINPLEIIAMFSNADEDTTEKTAAKAEKIKLAANLLSLKTGKPKEAIEQKLNEITKNHGFITIMSTINKDPSFPNKIKEKMKNKTFVSTWMSSLSANLNSGSTDSFITLFGSAVAEIQNGTSTQTSAVVATAINPANDINVENLTNADAVKEEEEEEKIKNIFQELINESLENSNSTLYKKIVEINAGGNDIFIDKLLKVLADTLPIGQGEKKIRFIKDFKNEFDVDGGKKTRRKRKRRKCKGKGTKRKNVTKRRK